MKGKAKVQMEFGQMSDVNSPENGNVVYQFRVDMTWKNSQQILSSKYVHSWQILCHAKRFYFV